MHWSAKYDQCVVLLIFMQISHTSHFLAQIFSEKCAQSIQENMAQNYVFICMDSIWVAG
jgi:hypothetical protein